MKYSGTSLTGDVTVDKSVLDLLKKINEVSDDTSSSTSNISSTVATVTKEPTGFNNPDNVVVSYSSTDRTITLSGIFQGYWRGVAIPGLTTGWISPVHNSGYTQPIYLSYNGTIYSWSTSPWTFDQLQIAIVTFDGGGFRFATRETHGVMQWQSHQEDHQVIGTYLVSGGDISGITLSSTTAAQRRPIIATANIKDEDLTTSNAQAATQSNYTLFNLSGTSTVNWTTAQADIVLLSGANPYYNLNTSGTYSQALMGNNSYTAHWLVAIPCSADAASQAYRFIWIQGQSNGSISSQQALSFDNVSIGTLTSMTPEYIAISRVIVKYLGGNWTVEQVDKLLGTKNSHVTVGGSSAVTTDASLTGNGTPASPLGWSGVYTSTAGSIALAITANSISNSNDAVTINSTSTARNGSSALLNINSSGTNAGASTIYGLTSSITNTTNSTNIAVRANASGGDTANYSLYSTAGSMFHSGNVSIGGGVRNAAALTVIGKINIGDATQATSGQVYIEGFYSATDSLPIWGSEYTSGGALMGYAVRNDGAAVGSFKSTSSISVGRNAYVINGTAHNWYIGAPQAVAVGSAVTTSKAMTLDTGGNLSLLGITASIEIGSTTANNTPFIDFHSYVTGSDYDARIIASGGNGSVGGGALQIACASLNLPTIASGTWNGSLIDSTYGGTGVNNAARTLTIGTQSGTITFTGATLTVGASASVSGSNTGDQTGGTPALTLGTTNTAGNASTFIRTNDTILAFDATVPVTQAFSDAAATGSATVAARRDHKHAMMAPPTTVSGNAGTVTVAVNSTNAVYSPLFATATSGSLSPQTAANYTFNPSTSTLTALYFSGGGDLLSGTASSLTAGNATNAVTASNISGGSLSGTITPGTNNSYDIGAPSYYLRKLYSTNIDTTNMPTVGGTAILPGHISYASVAHTSPLIANYNLPSLTNIGDIRIQRGYGRFDGGGAYGICMPLNTNHTVLSLMTAQHAASGTSAQLQITPLAILTNSAAEASGQKIVNSIAVSYYYTYIVMYMKTS